MKIVILAGGLGTRLKEISEGRPKAMMIVGGRPFLEYQFEQLASFGLTRILMLIGYGGEMIREYVGSGSKWGVEVDYVQEDPSSLLGTGGELINALPKLEAEFMTLYGDSYLPVDFRDVVSHYQSRDVPYLMTVYKNDGLWDASNTRIDGDWVTYYNKKALPGDADYIDYGMSVIRREVMERYASEPRPLDMARIQSDLVASKEMGALEVTERFYEIGKPSALLEFEEWILKQGS